jgi:hypothetical protein
MDRQIEGQKKGGAHMSSSLHSLYAAPAAHSPHGPYCSLRGQWPPRTHAPKGAVGDGDVGPGGEGELHADIPCSYALGPATLWGVFAAFALVVAAALSARAAPNALGLLAGLNLPAALHALTPAGLCAASGVFCATLALLLGHCEPDAIREETQADGRAWATLHLERVLRERRRTRWAVEVKQVDEVEPKSC